MSWFSENFSTAEQDLAERKAQQLRNSARRIWIKADTHIDVVFLDDRAFTFDEHKVWSGGEPFYFTCLGVKAGCPLCLDGHDKGRVTMFSVIDTSKWTDKKGNVHENEKKVLVVGPEQANVLREKKQSWGGLMGKAVRIRRAGSRSPASGTEFEALMRDGKMVQVDVGRYKDNKPFDYTAIFAPQPRDQVVLGLAKAKKNADQSQPVGIEGAAAMDSLPPPADHDAPAGEVEDNNIPF